MNEMNSQIQDAPPVPARMYVIFIVYTLGFPAVIFLAAGTLRWPAGWWYYAIVVLAALLSRLLAYFVHPDMLRERGRSLEAENTAGWDRLLSPLVGLVLPVVVLVVCGLDHRWNWSPALPGWVPPLALALIVLAYAFTTWAFLANRFFSGVVRIQAERGHEVVSGGPYRIVRHPGYLGALVAILATPLLLGSLWGLAPAMLYIVAVVARTALEDRMLQAELPGYRKYTRKTRWRLLPGMW